MQQQIAELAVGDAGEISMQVDSALAEIADMRGMKNIIDEQARVAQPLTHAAPRGAFRPCSVPAQRAHVS